MLVSIDHYSLLFFFVFFPFRGCQWKLFSTWLKKKEERRKKVLSNFGTRATTPLKFPDIEREIRSRRVNDLLFHRNARVTFNSLKLGSMQLEREIDTAGFCQLWKKKKEKNIPLIELSQIKIYSQQTFVRIIGIIVLIPKKRKWWGRRNVDIKSTVAK